MITLVVAIVVALIIFGMLRELAPVALGVLAVGWVLMKLHNAL